MLENALDFSPKSATVFIKLRVTDHQAHLQIDDEGSGIPDYAVEKVFERFFSLRHHQHGRKGTGLGLNLVKEAADLHHGSISLTNREIIGARADFRIPLV